LVLPESWTASLFLLILSVCLFVLWPNLFKIAGSKWRFELFSLDFALGAVLVAMIAAYTLGSRGSELDFSDSMLVAGRRAQAMAIAAGAIFATGNMLYLGTIALLGLSNGTLLTFGVFGCGVGLSQLTAKHYLTPATAFLCFAVAAGFAFLSAKAAREAATARGAAARGSSAAASKAMTLSTKGGITGLLAGLAFAAVTPVLATAQTDEMGIGAYGGVLMAGIGVVIATVFLNFFLMNISLEGGSVGYGNYLAGTVRNHALGAMSGAVWTAAALALYTAKTGAGKVTGFDAWLVPFSAAVLMVLTGVIFWQKIQLPAAAKRNKWLAAVLFVAGAVVLLAGIHRP
jgi:glucose uptake protein